MMNKEKKKIYINEMSAQFQNAESVLVTHYQGLTVKQLDDLRSKMREHGIQFKITKNRITKLLLKKQNVKIYQSYLKDLRLSRSQRMPLLLQKF